MAKTKLNPDDYEDKVIDDEENPELTEDDFARARPVKEVLPELYAQWEAQGHVIPVKRIGRPPVAQPKVHIGFRLSADIVERIRTSGRGYNSRVEAVLRAAIKAKRL